MCFFFFKQKTAYEMRISDWSSDVCSSYLRDTERVAMCAAGSTWRPPWVEAGPKPNHPEPFGTGWLAWGCAKGGTNCKRLLFPCVECLGKRKIGRASCGERGCQYV